jgi:hypothetical protein
VCAFPKFSVKEKEAKRKELKNMNKETTLNNFGSGWHSLIEEVYAIQDQLAFCNGIYVIERKNGMLSVIFKRTDLTNSTHEFILKSIEYRIERLTAKICEECGQYGLRRTDLPRVQTLCTRCYALKYSEVNTVPSLVANQQPQDI